MVQIDNATQSHVHSIVSGFFNSLLVQQNTWTLSQFESISSPVLRYDYVLKPADDIFTYTQINLHLFVSNFLTSVSYSYLSLFMLLILPKNILNFQHTRVSDVSFIISVESGIQWSS
jgi:hypothetical protein